MEDKIDLMYSKYNDENVTPKGPAWQPKPNVASGWQLNPSAKIESEQISTGVQILSEDKGPFKDAAIICNESDLMKTKANYVIIKEHFDINSVDSLQKLLSLEGLRYENLSLNATDFMPVKFEKLKHLYFKNTEICAPTIIFIMALIIEFPNLENITFDGGVVREGAFRNIKMPKLLKLEFKNCPHIEKFAFATSQMNISEATARNAYKKTEGASFEDAFSQAVFLATKDFELSERDIDLDTLDTRCCDHATCEKGICEERQLYIRSVRRLFVG